jgi:hypothetical protein
LIEAPVVAAEAGRPRFAAAGVFVSEERMWRRAAAGIATVHGDLFNVVA